MIRWLRRLWRSRRERPRTRTRGLRMLLASAHARRIAAAAKREEMSTADFDDALTLLATLYPVTIGDVLTVVEQVGLARAHAQLEEMCHGDP